VTLKNPFLSSRGYNGTSPLGPAYTTFNLHRLYEPNDVRR